MPSRRAGTSPTATTSTGTSSGSAPRRGPASRLAKPASRRGRSRDDEYFGPMEVYYGSVAAHVPVAGAASGDAVDVGRDLPGLREAGLCYPPITRTVSLLLPAALAAAGGGAAPGGGGSSFPDSGGEGEAPRQSNLRAAGADGGASGASGSPNPGSAGAPPGGGGPVPPGGGGRRARRAAGAGPDRPRPWCRATAGW